MSVSDTIFGLSSGQGRAGVAVIRVSGPETEAVVRQLVGYVPEARVARLCAFRDPAQGDILDRGLLLFFPGPASFTGEDCAEFHIHGSLAVVGALNRVLSGFKGLRAALAGEFTSRAYRNGKLSLSEVEALADLLSAETELQRRVAIEGSDTLRSKIENWRASLIATRALLEAMIDFSDEDDVKLTFDSDVKHQIEELLLELRGFHQKSGLAERVRSGFTVAIIGPPNAGKSSLLNRLIGRQVALTSPEPGTTRDVIQGLAEIDGIPVTFLDTAGLRDTPQSAIEAEGMLLSRQVAKSADLVLWVSSVESPVESPDISYLSVLSKGDLKPSIAGTVSVVSGNGLDSLTEHIRERLGLVVAPALMGALAVSERQRSLVGRALSSLEQALHHGYGSLDCCAEEVRLAALALEGVIGRVVVDDILDVVFSRFCIGK